MIYALSLTLSSLCCGHEYLGVSLSPGSVPRDGVPSIFVAGLEGSAPQTQLAILEGLSVAVTDASGEPVPGGIQLYEDFAVVVWRPAQRWTPGTYTFAMEMDYESVADALPERPPPDCVHSGGGEFSLEVREDTLPLTPPFGTARLEEEETGVSELDEFVCCDGSYPWYGWDPVGSCPSYRLHGAGSCISKIRKVWARVFASVDTSNLNEDEVSNLRVRLAKENDPTGSAPIGPEQQRRIEVSTCLRFEALDLARGEVHTLVDECFGDPERLGEFVFDPTEELAELCEGRPYVCEVADSRWDRDACSPWGPDPEPEPDPDPDPEGGGGCSVDERPDGGLGLCVLLLLAMRSRGDVGPRAARDC